MKLYSVTVCISFFFWEQTIFCEIAKNAVQDNSWFLLGFSGRRHDGEPNCAKYQWHTNDEGVQVNSRSFRLDYATADLRVRRASVSRLHISCVAQRQKVRRQVNKRVNTNRPLGVHPFFQFLLFPPVSCQTWRWEKQNNATGTLGSLTNHAGPQKRNEKIQTWKIWMLWDFWQWEETDVPVRYLIRDWAHGRPVCRGEWPYFLCSVYYY